MGRSEVGITIRDRVQKSSWPMTVTVVGDRKKLIELRITKHLDSSRPGYQFSC